MACRRSDLTLSPAKPLPGATDTRKPSSSWSPYLISATAHGARGPPKMLRTLWSPIEGSCSGAARLTMSSNVAGRCNAHRWRRKRIQWRLPIAACSFKPTGSALPRRNAVRYRGFPGQQRPGLRPQGTTECLPQWGPHEEYLEPPERTAKGFPPAWVVCEWHRTPKRSRKLARA